MLFFYLLLWFIGLSTIWQIVVFSIFGGTIWGLFTWLSSIIMYGVSFIVPNKKVGFWIILIMSLYNGIKAIYRLWTVKDDYGHIETFLGIVCTVLIVELTFALILGASNATENG